MQTDTMIGHIEMENQEDIFQEQMVTLSQDSSLTAENVNTVQEDWNLEAINTNTTSHNADIATYVEDSPFEESFDNEVRIGGGSTEFEILDDTITIEDVSKTIILVRRGHALSDLMQAFSGPALMDKDINIRMKLPNRKIEEGTGSGVFRDCFT